MACTPPRQSWNRERYRPPQAPGEGCLLSVMVLAGLLIAVLLAWPLLALGMAAKWAYPIGLAIVLGGIRLLVVWRVR